MAVQEKCILGRLVRWALRGNRPRGQSVRKETVEIAIQIQVSHHRFFRSKIGIEKYCFIVLGQRIQVNDILTVVFALDTPIGTDEVEIPIFIYICQFNIPRPLIENVG